MGFRNPKLSLFFNALEEDCGGNCKMAERVPALMLMLSMATCSDIP